MPLWYPTLATLHDDDLSTGSESRWLAWHVELTVAARHAYHLREAMRSSA